MAPWKVLANWELPGPEGWSLVHHVDTSQEYQRSGPSSPAHPLCSEYTIFGGKTEKAGHGEKAFIESCF